MPMSLFVFKQNITKYGGSIDKYMGDAVLAVFEGEEKELRAVKSAVEIQGHRKHE